MDKVFQQHQNVVSPFAKRGNLDGEYVQPVVEVRAKCPVGNGGFQIAIRCRYYADIDLNGLRAADAFEFTFLQHSQERNLSVQRHLADFVEENGSSVRQFKSTEAALHRSGERALFVAKEFGRNQRWSKSGTVHAHEGALRPTRSLMDSASDQFLTSSSLSTNKNARIGGRNFHQPRKHSLQPRRGADDLFEHERLVDLLPERKVFVTHPLFGSLPIFNIRPSGIPANNVPVVVAKGIVADKKPAIVTVFSKRSLLKFKRLTAHERLLALLAQPFHVLGVEDPCALVFSLHVFQSETDVIEHCLICIKGCPIRAEHVNITGDGVGHPPKLFGKGTGSCQVGRTGVDEEELTGAHHRSHLFPQSEL